MDTPSHHEHHSSDDTDRTNHFLSPRHPDNSLRERAASQPPRTSDPRDFPSSSPNQRSFAGAPGRPPWMPRTSSGLNPGLNPNTLTGQPSSVPTRSSSFSTSPNTQASFASALRDSRLSSAATTPFEDDESERLSDTYDEHFLPSLANQARGRSWAIDPSRSRSQSLATTRQPPIGSPFAQPAVWNEPALPSAMSIPNSSRYPPARYDHLGAPPSAGADVSNMSPFVRDVGQILLDDGSAFRELWAGMHPPRDEHGGGSGTTSRRHSVSVVQPRRGTVVGFGAGDADEGVHTFRQQAHAYGRGGAGLLLSDEDLAADLGMLNLQDGPGPAAPSQPSSLPVYRSASRSPYQPLSIATSFERDDFREQQQQQQQYMGSPGLARASYSQGPLSPGGTRAYAGAPPMARRPSDAAPPPSAVESLGRGVPLSAVPASWPLYIVEFKAGRTDLFYCTNLSLDIRIGDLVIVEADRGKDLGKVVNDTITLAEVETFQKEQQAKAGIYGMGGEGQPSGGGKEINPKMIYGKAGPQDTHMLVTKMQDEVKALQLCQQKVRQKKLPMEVIDAEYQWDRRKLTFYFIAEKRIDFRELVRELFRLYKTRIWMASLQGPVPAGFEH